MSKEDNKTIELITEITAEFLTSSPETQRRVLNRMLVLARRSDNDKVKKLWTGFHSTLKARTAKMEAKNDNENLH